MNTIVHSVIRTGIVYLFITLAHFSSVHLYAYICLPFTVKGVLTSPFIIPSPHCQALVWTIHYTNGHILQMWILLGIFIINNIELSIKTKKLE